MERSAAMYAVRRSPILDRKVEALKAELDTPSNSEIIRRAVDFYFSAIVEADKVKFISQGCEREVVVK